MVSDCFVVVHQMSACSHYSSIIQLMTDLNKKLSESFQLLVSSSDDDDKLVTSFNGLSLFDSQPLFVSTSLKLGLG